MIVLTTTPGDPCETEFRRRDRDAVAHYIEGLPDGMGTTKEEIGKALGWNPGRVARAIGGTDRFHPYRCRVHGIQPIVYAPPAVVASLISQGGAFPVDPVTTEKQ